MSVAWNRLVPFLILSATACGGPEPAQAPNAAPPSAEAPPATSAEAPGPAAPKAGAAPGGEAPAAPENPAAAEPPPDTPRLTLLDPGQPPRRKLRYAFTMKPETLVLDIDMKMTMRMGDKQSPEAELPTIRTTMKIVPKSVSPEGDLTYEGRIEREEVLSNGPLPAEVRAKLQQSLKSMSGMKVASTVTSRGVVKEATMQIPDDAAPEVKQTLESTRDALRTMCTPLPEEEVGAGARWRTDVDVQTAFRLNQSTTMTVTKLENHRMQVDAVLVQSAPAQPVTAGVPAGTTLRLEKLSGTGKGTMDVRFDHVTPQSTLAMDNESVMTVSAGGQSVVTGTQLHLVVKVKPGK